MRKFRVWDSIELAKSLKLAIQIRSKIQEICLETKTTVAQAPHSLVPTSNLYDLTVCYEALYNKLLELNLLETGNLNSKNKTNIH